VHSLVDHLYLYLLSSTRNSVNEDVVSCYLYKMQNSTRILYTIFLASTGTTTSTHRKAIKKTIAHPGRFISALANYS
jgi:hypothetical protein